MLSKNAYMFPHGSPSSHPRASASASLLGLNGNDIFLHHHHDMLAGHYSSADAAAAFSLNHDINGLNGEPSSAMANPCQLTTKAASKKDRHSKIYTAQGPRDRRVRLSIGVARKFFDLQEILGFDKPSKTLDWLLTKSKTAIKDLLQMREKGSSDAAKSGSSECEVDSGEALEKGKSILTNSGMLGAVAPASNLAKESRVKARARARERTREKMSIKKLNETRNSGTGGGYGYDLSPTIPIQFMNNQLEFRKISSSSSNINVGMLHCHEAENDQDLIQESIVIKRKVKHPSILGFQQNLIISSSNYGVPPPYNAENWDISSCFTASQSNICAILDQHKFINGASNN